MCIRDSSYTAAAVLDDDSKPASRFEGTWFRMGISELASFKPVIIGLLYKLLSATYKAITASQHSYLYNLISLQPPRCTRTSSVETVVTLAPLRQTTDGFRLGLTP